MEWGSGSKATEAPVLTSETLPPVRFKQPKRVPLWAMVVAGTVALATIGGTVFYEERRLSQERAATADQHVMYVIEAKAHDQTSARLDDTKAALDSAESELGTAYGTIGICQEAVAGTYKARNFAWNAASDFRKAAFADIFSLIALIKEGDGHLAQSNQAFTSVRHEEYLCRTASTSGSTVPL